MFVRIDKTKHLRHRADTEYDDETAYSDDIDGSNNGSNTDDDESSICW
jgi:hypothetical protein